MRYITFEINYMIHTFLVESQPGAPQHFNSWQSIEEPPYSVLPGSISTSWGALAHEVSFFEEFCRKIC